MAKKTSTKKMVIFIVEGKTDKTALEMIFKKIYTQKEIKFEFMNGDVTSDENITTENVEDMLYAKVKECMNYYKLQKSDIWMIVQIFDTDGAYIPDEAIKQKDVEKFEYSTTNIFAKNREKVVERNLRKSKLMDFLVRKDKIENIPYEGYFMSSNLEHALYNMQNLDEEKKKAYSSAFYSSFSGKEKQFIAFIEKYVVNHTPNNYSQSWKYIREGVNSLERHTNLHIYFLKNPSLNLY